MRWDSGTNNLGQTGTITWRYYGKISRRVRIPFYYIDKSVLVETRPLVHLGLHSPSGTQVAYFSYSLVRISMTSFPALTPLFGQKYFCLHDKKKITR